MSVLYITEQGATIQRRANRFIVSKDKKVLQEVPDQHLKQMVLYGNIQITTPVIAYCLESGIDVSFLSSRGKYRGRLFGEMQKSSELRQMQYARTQDGKFRLIQARAIVSGKITNMLAMMRRQREHGSTQKNMHTLNGLISKTNEAQSLDSLLGYEGAASAAYFSSFGSWMPAGWEFKRRVAHPPDGAVNALLSLGYTMLYNQMVGVINIVGLDPYQGCFHSVRQAHAALSSDLVECFRSIVVDALVIRLIRNKILHLSDIKRTAEDGWRLQPDAFKKFLVNFEEKMNSRRETEAENQKLSYRQIIELQARQYARVVTGEDKTFKPFTIK